jgi:hypothetical protein
MPDLKFVLISHPLFLINTYLLTAIFRRRRPRWRRRKKIKGGGRSTKEDRLMFQA